MGSTDIFRVELLPAAHGDAIWIEYGPASKPRRVIVDGGPASSYEKGLQRRVRTATRNGKVHVDLLVVTHIDADHIDGAILLLREAKRLGVQIDEVWFNGWPQLETYAAEHLQPLQGEFLGALLALDVDHQRAWNQRTRKGPILVSEEGALPSWELPGGARITLLSPCTRQLRRLRARWTSAIREFTPGDAEEALRRLEARREYRPPSAPPVFGSRSYGDDRAVANGSSIAFVLEYGGASCLLAGDAHARVLTTALGRLAAERNNGRMGPIRLDAVKLPHHGSLSNITGELLSFIETKRWLISTNGAIFGHPDVETAELIARSSSEIPELVFNYRPKSEHLINRENGWRASYPRDVGTPGMIVDLLPVDPKAAAPRKRSVNATHTAPAIRRRKPKRERK